MAIATEKNVSEKRTNVPDEPARRMLYRTLFTPRVGVPFDDERTTHVHLGVPEMYMKMKELGVSCARFLTWQTAIQLMMTVFSLLPITRWVRQPVS